MPTISNLNAMVTATVAGFSAGMHTASSDVGGFGESFKSAAGVVAGAAAAMGIGLSLDGVTEYLKGAFESIDANSHLAASLGISTQALGRLQYSASLAGVASEELSGGLVKMLKNIDAARDGSKSATEAFDKIGISVKDLAGLSPDQAFAKIGDALSKMTDPAERAHATMELFGKTGTSLLPILTEGADKLSAEAAEADKFGVALNGIDSAKVENAHESIAKVEEVIEGAANKLIVAMAPYIDIVAQKLVAMSQDGQGMAAYLVAGFEGITKGVAAAADYLELLVAGFDTMKAGGELAIAGIEFGFGALLNVAGKVLDFFHISHDGLTEYAEEVTRTHQQMMDDAAAAWNDAQHHVDSFVNGDNSAKVAALFDGIKVKADVAAKATADVHDKMGALGAGSDEPDKDKASADAHKKQLEEIHKLYEETRTPQEKYAEQVQNINALFASGELDVDTYGRALAKAQGDLDKTISKKEKLHHLDVDAPHALEAGSSEAAEFIAKFQSQQRENAKEAEIAKNTEKMAGVLERVATALVGKGQHTTKVLSW